MKTLLGKAVRVFVTYAIALSASLIGSTAQAMVIDFEDIQNPDCCTPLISGYQGFNWYGGSGNGSWVITNEDLGTAEDLPESWGWSPHSGANFAWSPLTSLTMSSDSTFDFNSVWVRGGSSGGSNTVQGFLNGNLIYSQLFEAGKTYQLLSLDFIGVDQITFAETTEFNLLIDDITVNATRIPEPASLALFGIALAALGATRLKKAF